MNPEPGTIAYRPRIFKTPLLQLKELALLQIEGVGRYPIVIASSKKRKINLCGISRSSLLKPLFTSNLGAKKPTFLRISLSYCIDVRMGSLSFAKFLRT
jgi:hypothetical protein